jgi:hypothetical protein
LFVKEIPLRTHIEPAATEQAPAEPELLSGSEPELVSGS